MTVNILCLLLTVPWVGIQCMIVVFPSYIPSFVLNIIVKYNVGLKPFCNKVYQSQYSMVISL